MQNLGVLHKLAPDHTKEFLSSLAATLIQNRAMWLADEDLVILKLITTLDLGMGEIWYDVMFS